MRVPRMTTRQLMVAVLILAAWFAFVARAGRLRGMGREHMERYTVLTREAIVLREGRQHANADAARAAAAANLQTAQRYNVEADFVESFTLALFLAGAAFGATVVVRWRRGRSNTVRREPDGVGPG